MVNMFKQLIEKDGDKKVSVISVECLSEIYDEIEALKNTNWLNDFQKFIVNEIYDLKVPQLDFEIKSIIIVAFSNNNLVNLIFNKDGRKIKTLLPPGYRDYTTGPQYIEKCVGELLNSYGYHSYYAPNLPRKLLATKSGLSTYGRNNISYIKGMGSFYHIVPFYSDLPCDKKELFEITQMKLCKSCSLCAKNCPTNAILKDRYLINNERCLTYMNEYGGDFPEWVDISAHNSIYGCMKCQMVCPHNIEALKKPVETVEFTEEETVQLIEESSFENYSTELKQKVQELNMMGYLSALPRNIEVLFEQR